MKYYLGLDVGGTNLAAGIVDENYHLLYKESIPAGGWTKCGRYYRRYGKGIQKRHKTSGTSDI